MVVLRTYFDDLNHVVCCSTAAIVNLPRIVHVEKVHCIAASNVSGMKRCQNMLRIGGDKQCRLVLQGKSARFGMGLLPEFFDDPVRVEDILFSAKDVTGESTVEVCSCGETKKHKVL